MTKAQHRAKKKRFVILLIIGFFLVAFLTGCGIFGPMEVIKHNNEEVYESDESLLIPPDVIDDYDTELDEIMLSPKTYFIGPLECDPATYDCEGYII